MLKVGITGGIGAGKSTICKVFNALQIPVYHADQRAKILTETDPVIRSEIIREFGERSYRGSKYNVEYVAARAFGDKIKLSKLNHIIHPAVSKDFYQWVRRQKAPYIIEEAAILFESGANQNMDHVIVVEAPEEIRISRIQKRDGIAREEIKKRIDSQWSADKLHALADWVVNNNDKVLVLPQILSIHNFLLTKLN